MEMNCSIEADEGKQALSRARTLERVPLDPYIYIVSLTVASSSLTTISPSTPIHMFNRQTHSPDKFYRENDYYRTNASKQTNKAPEQPQALVRE
jgi:hypothetical protein